jgi:hypothetical protein
MYFCLFVLGVCVCEREREKQREERWGTELLGRIYRNVEMVT